jgi:hypothetical protein
MAKKRDKILLYLDKLNKKNILVYKEEDLLDLKLPIEYIDNGTNMYLDTLKEKWKIIEVKKSTNELTLKFQMVFRNKEKNTE